MTTLNIPVITYSMMLCLWRKMEMWAELQLASGSPLSEGQPSRGYQPHPPATSPLMNLLISVFFRAKAK